MSPNNRVDHLLSDLTLAEKVGQTTLLEAGEFDVQVGELSVGVIVECEPARCEVGVVRPLVGT